MVSSQSMDITRSTMALKAVLSRPPSLRSSNASRDDWVYEGLCINHPYRGIRFVDEGEQFQSKSTNEIYHRNIQAT